MNFKSNKAYKNWLAYGHASGKFAKTPGHQSVSIKGKSKKVKHNNGGDIVSQLGYKDYSPFRNASSLEINTPNKYIDMTNVSTDLYANGKFLPSNSGLHYMGTTKVLETPVQESNVFMAGGKVPNIPTWNYPSKGTPIYRNTTEIPANKYEYGGGPGDPPPISEQALQQWHKQNIELWNPQGSSISEGSEIGKQTLGNWWSKIGREDYAKQASEGNTPHWSALAISLAEMSMLGASNQEEAKALGFQPSSAHSTYIRNAFKTTADNNYKYNARLAAPVDNKPQVGDIYFYGRKGKTKDASNWEFDDFKNATEHYPSHSDMVVDMGKDKGGEYVILAGGNNRFNSYGQKKVYTKNLTNKYKGKLIRNLNSPSLPKDRFEKIAKEPTKEEPLYAYASEIPEHQETIQKLNYASTMKLEQLPNLIRFSILEGIRTNKYSRQQAEEEINIALEDKNSYLQKLLKPTMMKQARANFAKGSALGKSRM